ncbi:MAG: tyrosine-type recombinase/integrase [Dehalococcoidia bacterium]|nr:tyrosine-type recombinase/integrase [Dehalococcoidia bacterium]
MQALSTLPEPPAQLQPRMGDTTPSDDLRVQNAREKSLSEHTRRNYRYQWDIWRGWAEFRSASVLPAHPAMVERYIAERAELGRKPSTLRTALAAIAYIHRITDMPSPITEDVRATLKGLTELAGREQRQAPALTAEGMAAVRATACLPRRGRGGRPESAEYARARGLMDIAILALMRDALLRVGEASALTWGCLSREPNGTGRLAIVHSKTDREGRGAVVYVSRQTMTDVDAIRDESAMPGASMFGLTRRQLINRVKAACAAAGLGNRYSGHSARVGMARDLVRAGTELSALMNAGRWRSHDMPAHYTRAEAAGRGAVAQYYGD